MEVIPLQDSIIYGPVLSRRLGRSLGLNILSPYRKICNFNCIYCQYGKTNMFTSNPGAEALLTVSEILKSTEIAFRVHRNLDYLTFSGNGEPTLHPDFPEIVEKVKKLRDTIRPEVKLAIFSNATMLVKSSVREAMQLFEMPILKLDAGDEGALMAIDRPLAGIHLAEIIVSLKIIERFVIQSLFIHGRITNSEGEAYQAWLEAIQKIHPLAVQVYSSDQPVVEEDVLKVPARRLIKIVEDLHQMGLKATAYWA